MVAPNKVIFDIIANTDQYSKGLKGVNKQTQAVTKVMKASFVAVSAVMAGSLVTFASFETALVKVGKTTGLEGKALQGFGEKIVEMTAHIPLSSTRLLELAASAAQLGVKGEKNILAFTETMAKLETATNILGEEGSASVARFLKITGDGVKNVARFGATITGLGNQTAATESEILHMATRVAQATAQFDIGGTATLGISAALKDLGFEAELAGTAMGRTFKTLQTAVFEGGAALETLIRITGKTREELKQTFEEDATKSFEMFIEALSKLPANEVISSLKEMGLSGERVSSVLATLAAKSEGLAKSLKIAREEAEKQTALDIEFKAAIDTLATSFNFFMNEVKNLAASIGEDLAPEVKELFEDLTNILRALRKLNDETGGFISGTFKLTAQVTLLYLAFNKLEKMMKLTGKTSIFLSRAWFMMTGGAIKGAGAIKSLKLAFIGLNTTLKATQVSLGGVVAGIWFAVKAGQALGKVWVKLSGDLGKVANSEENLIKSQKKLLELQKERIQLEFKGNKKEELALLDKEISKQKALTNEYQRQVNVRKKQREEGGSGSEERIADAEMEKQRLAEIEIKSAEEKALRDLENREAEIEIRSIRFEEDLAAIQEELLSKQDVKDQAKLEEKTKEVEHRNQFLKDEQKFGKTFAKLNKFMNNDRVKGAETAANELVALKNSENSKLKAIGQAAAIAQIGMDTARGAMSAYASLAGIPIVGPTLGAAAALAVVLYGGEQAAIAASFAVGTDFVPNDMVAQIHQGERISTANENSSLNSGEAGLFNKSFISDLAQTNNNQNTSGLVINVNFDGATINGNLDEEMTAKLAEDISTAIDESRIAPFPTGVEV